MKKIEASVVIECRPENVWEFVTDISNAPTWDPAAVEMTQTSIGAPGPGTTLHLTLSEFSKAEDFRVIEYEPNRRYALEYTSGPVKGTTMAFDLEPVDGKTKLSMLWDLEYQGINKLIGPLITRNAKSEGDTFIANIKRLVESEPKS